MEEENFLVEDMQQTDEEFGAVEGEETLIQYEEECTEENMDEDIPEEEDDVLNEVPAGLYEDCAELEGQQEENKIGEDNNIGVEDGGEDIYNEEDIEEQYYEDGDDITDDSDYENDAPDDAAIEQHLGLNEQRPLEYGMVHNSDPEDFPVNISSHIDAPYKDNNDMEDFPVNTPSNSPHSDMSVDSNTSVSSPTKGTLSTSFSSLELTDARAELRRLELIVERLQIDITNEKEDNLQYRKEYEKIKAEGTALYTKFFGRGERIKELTNQNNKYATVNAAKDAEIQILKHAITEKDESILRIQQECNMLRAELGIVQIRDEQQSQELEVLRKGSAGFEALKNECDAWKKKYQLQWERLKSNYNTFQKMKEEHQEALKALQIELQGTKNTSTEFRTEIENALKDSGVWHESEEIVEQLQKLIAQVKNAEVLATTATPPRTARTSGGGPDLSNFSPESLKNKVEAVTISNELLREDNAALQGEISRLEELLQGGRQNTSTQMQQLQDAMIVKDNELAQMLNQVNSLQEQLNNIEQIRVQEREQLLGSHNTEIENLQSQLQQLAQECETSREAQDMAESMMREASVAIESEKALQQKVAEQAKVNSDLQADLRRAFNKYNKDIKHLREEFQHENYKQRYTEEKRKKILAEKQLNLLADAAKQIKGFGPKHVQWVAEIKENFDFLSKQKTQFSQTKQAFDASKSTITSLQCAKIELEHNVNLLRNDLSQTKAEANALFHEKTQLTDFVSQLKAELDTAEKKLVEEREKAGALDGYLKSATEQNEGASQFVGELSAQVEQLTEENNKLRSDVAQLTANLEEVEQNLTRTNEELVATQDTLAYRSDNLFSIIQKTTAQQCAQQIVDEMMYKAVVSSLRSKVQALQQQVQEKTALIEELNGIVSTLKTETQKDDIINKLNIEVARWRHKHDELSEFVEDERAVRVEQEQDMEREIQNAKDLLTASEQREQEIRAELVSCQNLLEEAKYKESSLQVEHESLQEQIQLLSSQHCEVLHAKHALQAQVSDLQAQLSDIHNNWSTKYEECARVKEDTEQQLMNEMSDIKANMDDFVQLYETERSEKENFMRQVQDLESKFESLQQNFAVKCEDEFALRTKLQQLTEQSDHMVAEYNKQIEEARERLVHKENEVEAEKAARSAEVQDLIIVHNDLSAKVHSLSEDLERSRADLDQSTQFTSSLVTERDAVQADLYMIRSQYEQAVGQNANLFAELAQVKSDLMRSTADLERSSADLERSSTDLENSIEQLRVMTSERDELANRLDSVGSEVQNREGELMEQHNQAVSKLTEELKNRTAKLKETTAQLQQLSEENVAVNNKLKEAAQQFMALKKGHEQDVAYQQSIAAQLKAHNARLEGIVARDKSTKDELQKQLEDISQAKARVEEEGRKFNVAYQILLAEKDKIAQQVESLLVDKANASQDDQETSKILREKFEAQKEATRAHAQIEACKNEIVRLKKESKSMEHAVQVLKAAADQKIAQLSGSLKEIEAAKTARETQLQQIRTALLRNQPVFAISPESSQVYNMCCQIVGVEQQK